MQVITRSAVFAVLHMPAHPSISLLCLSVSIMFCLHVFLIILSLFLLQCMSSIIIRSSKTSSLFHTYNNDIIQLSSKLLAVNKMNNIPLGCLGMSSGDIMTVLDFLQCSWSANLS